MHREPSPMLWDNPEGWDWAGLYADFMQYCDIGIFLQH